MCAPRKTPCTPLVREYIIYQVILVAWKSNDLLSFQVNSGYKMESGEDLVKFKEHKTFTFPENAW